MSADTRQPHVATAAPDEPIAVVSMGCRFPGGVETPEGLWRVVRDGLDVISDFPTNREWNLAELWDPNGEQSGTSYVSKGGFLHDAPDFDAAFFGISPREALAMDPQQRLLLESSWETLERAGLDPAILRGSHTGVFVGAMAQEYGPRLHEGDEQVDGHVLTGSTTSVASGRIAYTLGLEGPAVTVDTACSSSLVALHMAAQSLRAGECSMALAGGATVMSSPGIFVEFSRQRGLSPDGRCKPFAAGADGTGWGEGVGVLLLERLSDARANGHQVLAVLRGSAINQDGASNGLTAPNGPSQQRVIRAALANARLEPGDVDVVEAHGTGTTLGDPIEAQALLATYGEGRDPQRPLWLGSVKSNIGHAQAAAGVGGVIKMVQALRHGVLPKSLHAEAPSPEVDWSPGTVRLLDESVAWEPTDRPRRAGVSSFGISGTNAHVVLEEAPGSGSVEFAGVEVGSEGSVESAGAGESVGWGGVVPWVVSARSAEALRAQAAALVEFVGSRGAGLRSVDVGRTLLSGRAGFEHRAVVAGASREELVSGLGEVAAGRVDGVVAEQGRGPVFVFPGQGSQWVGMARELLGESVVFAEAMGECERALEPFVGWSLVGVLGDEEMLGRVDVVQPVLWAVMVSLSRVWEWFGVVPAAVVGHSQGEIAAAVVSGALSLEEGARVVAVRSGLIGGRLAGGGGMVSVGLSRLGVEELLVECGVVGVSVAAVNGPSSVVVSGSVEGLDVVVEACEGRGVWVRRVEVDYASHSVQVEGIEGELVEALAGLEPRVPRVPFFSTVSGGWLDCALGAEYWYRNLRESVRFAEACEGLLGEGFGVFVEPSAHPVLVVPVGESAEVCGVDVVVVGSLRRGEGGLGRLYASLGQVWSRGVEVDWSKALPRSGGEPEVLVDLPTYAFQRQRYWLAPGPAAQPQSTTDPVDAEFWETVDREDLEALADTLGIADASALAEVVPALSSWRRERQQRSIVDDWRYEIVWRERPVSDPAPAEKLSETSRLEGTWLLLVPAEYEATEAVTELTEALLAAGAEPHPMLVTAADAERESLAERLRAEKQALETVSGVLSLVALDESPLPGQPAVSTGLAATLALVQALGDVALEAPLWCLTRGAVAVGEEPAPYAPAQAAVWGLGRVAALEHPGRWGGLIDLPVYPVDSVGSAHSTDVQVPSRLVALLAGHDDEDQLALRADRTYVRRLVSVPAAASRSTTSGDWRPRGTVLVTGGTGALGARVARWLVDGGAEHLVLTGRRGDAAPGVAELRAELAARGVPVTVAACDMADRDAVRDLATRLADEGHAVRCVVHAAGVSQLGTLAEADNTDLDAALAGKVLGAEHLAEALAGPLDAGQLDAVVYFSSISGTWGVAEHGVYAAANAALDAYAQRRRADGHPVLSVAWGPWAGGGMIAESLQDVLRQRGVPVIDPDTALAGLQQALELDDTVVALADVDWRRFAGVFTSVRPSRLLDEIPAAQPVTEQRQDGEAAPTLALAGELAELDERQRTARLVTLVREWVAAVLGHAEAGAVDTRESFKEQGFDSLTAVELRNRLNAATGLRLASTVVFDYPNITALAGHLASRLLGDPAATGADRTGGSPGSVAQPGPSTVDEPIAIVSMSCRFPGGVETPEDLWRVVRDGLDVISDFPTNRGWDLEALYDPDPDSTGKSYVRRSGFLHDAADFDAAFFGISPREALAMDPQQRLLLETSWEALERAGIDPYSLRGSQTGVYVGMTDQEYGSRLRAASGEAEGYLATGAAGSVASGRISYTLGLEGPAVTVDTACSSALVATHQAVQALRAGECSMALAGAVMVMSDPSQFIAFSRQRGLAPDGVSKPFAAAADGFALSEGAGMIVLERLSDARANGHQVLAVLRGSAINQDGASNGLTAPNGPSQQRVIRAALANARLEPGDVDVVEAHGTGTTLGDPIEAQALLATYGEGRDPQRPLWLGSVKSNIGHAQTASGMAGLMKMVQAFQHDLLPRSLHAEEPSPHVDWSLGGVELLAQAREWERGDRPRRAGVSSFGVSGTNAHVVLEEAPGSEGSVESVGSGESGESVGSEGFVGWGGVVPWVVSARSAEALRGQAERLVGFVEGVGVGVSVGAVGRSLVVGRAGFEHRAVVAGASREELVSGLGEVAAGRVDGVVAEQGRGPVFVFPGQGSQWVGMARELLGESVVFAEAMGECERALEPFVGWSLVGVLGDEEMLGRVDVVQPVLWAVMVSLSRVWEWFGVVPAAVVGHSQGEIAAAVVSGALSLEEGARVVAVRSGLIGGRLAGGGGMVSVGLSRLGVEELLVECGVVGVSVAAVNGPSSVVVSGSVEGLDVVVEWCVGRGVWVRRVEVDYASHSVQVEGIEGELVEALAGLEPRVPRVPFFSTVSGGWLDCALGAEYWYRNLRESVRFAEACEGLLGEGFGVFVEPSAHPVLVVPVGESAEVCGVDVVVVGSLRRGEGGLGRLYASLGQVWSRGVEVDWSKALPRSGGEPEVLVDLPTYAFQRQRYWLEAPSGGRLSGVVDPVDAEFWETVEREDVEGLADTLGIADASALAEVVPALSSWRRERQQRNVVEGWRYRVVWRQAEAVSGAGGVLSGRWLLVVPASGECGQWVERVRAWVEAAGAEVVVVSLAADEVEQAVVAERLTDALPEGDTPAGVLSLLALDEVESDHGPGVTRGLLATVALAQVLETGKVGLAAPLWIVTRGAVTTAPADPVVRPAQAAVRGLGRVFGLDTPDGFGGLIDLPETVDEPALARLSSLLADPAGEEDLAVRASGTFVRRMVRVPAEASRPAREPWQPSGTVLITGGTGALGGHVARELAGAGAEHLLLVSRRGPDAPGATELRAELQALGPRVTIAACDVAERAALAALLADIPEDLPLTGVVHTAGVVGEARSLAEIPVPEVAAIVRGKVAGALHLDELLAETELDAFVLFSSGAGVWGNGGQGPYAAANAQLDALAEHRHAHGRTATAIAWGAWADGGMVDEEVAEQLRRRGVPEMAPELAVRAVRAAVTGAEPTLVVADIRWDRFLPAYTSRGHRPLLDEVPEVAELLAAQRQEAQAAERSGAAEDPTAQLVARLTPLDAEQRGRALVDLVREHAGAVLGHATGQQVKADRPFRNLGFDSLTAVELRNRLTAATGLRLPAALIFDYPTPAVLADHLGTELLPPEPASAGARPGESADLPVELRQLEAAYQEAPDAESRQALADGLRKLLTTWDGDGPAGDGGIDEDVAAASDEDMFDLIDKELGIS
ncbi:hypothetical protein AN216_10595 [Streptomyces oceani]|uniref:Polyketide synthase n=1 Tax=Streptomyces oceani TaxID=1075402 RepID=A0A1E7KIM4_9ACTN|nr:hypothetical protein AN216_10595 [Streptomyces oceani]